MRSVRRPADEPAELTNLANTGSEDFGPLAPPLDRAFSGVCAYCERTTRDDDGDIRTRVFTCDHFKPRHLLCHHDPAIGQCTDTPPLHASDCSIYDWANLLYVCQSCADAKGGQWPRPGESADSYIDPATDPSDQFAPISVFSYDTDSGRLLVRDDVRGTLAGNNAQRTIDDLALNDPRGPRHERSRYFAKPRRINLAELRGQWVKRLREVLDALAADGPDVLRFVISEHTHPNCRFSSICVQAIQESQYAAYLPVNHP